MNSDQRRKEILELLKSSTHPISASALAGRLSVSRQIIVGDVALLRSSGEKIIATPRGYIFGTEQKGLIRQIAVRHYPEEMEMELTVIVDQGCTVLDVIVEHPVYGQLTGLLQLSNRYDVSQFIKRCREADAQPLSKLTEGIHLHTLSCPDEDAYSRVVNNLKKLSFLLEDPED